MREDLGRIKITTDAVEINENNVIQELQKALVYHYMNANRMDFLIKYERGHQPKIRQSKNYRADINFECIDNVANEVTEFKNGFHWGNPITLIQNKNMAELDKQEAISELNGYYDADNYREKTQEIGNFCEITSLCYSYIDLNSNWSDGESPFTITPLDPRTSFIVYSNYYIDHRKMMGVTYRSTEDGTKYFTVITDKQRFEIVDACKIVNGEVKKDKDGNPEHIWYQADRSGELNPFGLINMVEWLRSPDRMGCFERQIPDMDILNLEWSDFANSVEQNTDAVWHGNDLDFPVDEDGNEKRPSNGEWLLTETTPEGKQPFVKPLSITYDYAGVQNNINIKRALILQKCNVPQRNDSSGGSTGVAMSDATGWSSAEMAASKQQPLQEASKMDEVRIVLAVIKKSPHASEKLLSLKFSDMQPNIKRMKSYELINKTNAIATLLAKGFSLEDVLGDIPLFSDVSRVISNSGEGVKKYQETIFSKNDTKTENEYEDENGQIVTRNNSPNGERIASDIGDNTSQSSILDSSREQN